AIARVRAAREDIAFSSDFIVGFPGESEADHQATLSLVEEIGFASAYTFKYSPRPGTPAAELPEQVPEDVKSERLYQVQALITRQTAAFNASFIGRTLDVLFERAGRYGGQLVGRTPYLQQVQVTAPSSMIGTIAPVIMTELSANSLFGALVEAPA